jgi:hypothetical protein
MTDHQPQNVKVDARRLGPVSRHRSCLCSRGCDRDAEHRVLWLIAGERIPESLCTLHAAEVFGWDLEAMPAAPAIRGGCEYVSERVLNRSLDRRPANYRISHFLAC